MLLPSLLAAPCYIPTLGCSQDLGAALPQGWPVTIPWCGGALGHQVLMLAKAPITSGHGCASAHPSPALWTWPSQGSQSPGSASP